MRKLSCRWLVLNQHAAPCRIQNLESRVPRLKCTVIAAGNGSREEATCVEQCLRLTVMRSTWMLLSMQEWMNGIFTLKEWKKCTQCFFKWFHFYDMYWQEGFSSIVPSKQIWLVQPPVLQRLSQWDKAKEFREFPMRSARLITLENEVMILLL